MEEAPPPDDAAPGRTEGGVARVVLRWALVFASGALLVAGVCRLVEAARAVFGSPQFIRAWQTAVAWLLAALLVYPWRSRIRPDDSLPATALGKHRDAESGRRCMVHVACGIVMVTALCYAFQRFTAWRTLTQQPDYVLPWITHLESAALGAWALAFVAAAAFCAAFRFRLRRAAREDIQRSFFFAGLVLSGFALWALRTAWFRAQTPMDRLEPLDDPWWHALTCLLAVWMAGVATPRLAPSRPGAPVLLPALEDLQGSIFTFTIFLIVVVPAIFVNVFVPAALVIFWLFGSGSWFYEGVRKDAAKASSPPAPEDEP